MKYILPVILFLLICSVQVWSQIQGSVSVTDQSYIKEINRLKGKKKIQDAFISIDIIEPRTLNDLIYLTEIPAPPFQEQQRALAFKDLLEEAGVDRIWIDEVGNVIALKKGKAGKRTVVLDAHLDTVFPQGTDVTVKIKGDTLAAPGIGDDTRGLVVILTVLRVINQSGITTRDNIWIVGSVGEEGIGDLRGMKHLFREGADPIDAWISVDGGGIERISNGALGSSRYRVTFSGPGGHSWGDFGMANPHSALGLAISKFENEAGPYTRSGPKTSYNVGRIGGGTSVNSIPFESWMEMDLRSEDPNSLKIIDQMFRRTMKEALDEINLKRRDGEPLVLDIERIGSRPSGKTPESSPLVQRAMASISSFGATPTLLVGSTNSNIPISQGIPAVTIGIGGKGDGAHSLNEWWINKNGADAIKSALLILLSEAGFD